MALRRPKIERGSQPPTPAMSDGPWVPRFDCRPSRICAALGETDRGPAYLGSREAHGLKCGLIVVIPVSSSQFYDANAFPSSVYVGRKVIKRANLVRQAPISASRARTNPGSADWPGVEPRTPSIRSARLAGA